MTELQHILTAREERHLLRQQIAEGHRMSVSLNLNVPGFPKSNELYSIFFSDAIARLQNWLMAHRVMIDTKQITILNRAAGDFFLAAVQSTQLTVVQLKNLTESFEEGHPLGRFIDVDVADSKGNLVSSGKTKPCFFCEEFPAMDCIHSKRHTFHELRSFQIQKIEAYLSEIRLDRLSRRVSTLAIRSVLYEISLTPKPGLVDMSGSGVHQDMDYTLFLDSTAMISMHFQTLLMKGARCSSDELSSALPIIRAVGLTMEQEMFAQTKGVNTQKGIIFLMGVSLFCAGYVLQNKDEFCTEDFRKAVQVVCKDMVKSEFVEQDSSLTHGEVCFKKFSVGGIRQEVEAGFPTVFDYGLPVLDQARNTSVEALQRTLLALISGLDDTNVLYRSSKEVLDELQLLSREVLADFSMMNYQKIIRFCKNQGISPGGSADLLSITIFIFLLKTNLTP